MAIHFLPQEQSGLAQSLGALGGIGLGLLSNYTSNQLSLPGKIKNLEGLGFSKQEAESLANSPEVVQSAALKEKMKAIEREKQAQVFSNLISGGQQLPVQQPAISQPGLGSLGALGGPEQQAQVPEPGKTPDIGKTLSGRSVEELQEYRDRVLRSGGDPQLVRQAVEILDRQIAEKIKIKSAERKESLEERKFGAAEQREINKETKPFYDSVKTKAKDAKENDVRLDRMEELAKSNKLTGPGTYKLLNQLGVPLDPSDSEFEKLTTEFLKNLKSVFGGRISNIEMETYLRSLPSLALSNPGRLRLIRNMKLMNEGAKAENEAMKQIIKEHGGKRPANLEDLVEERIKPTKDRLAQEFKSGASTEIPEETGLERLERIGVPLATSAAKIGGPAIIGGLLAGPAGAALGGLGGAALDKILGLLGK